MSKQIEDPIESRTFENGAIVERGYIEYEKLGKRREWWVHGKDGAVSFWVRAVDSPIFGEDLMGGVEYHYKEHNCTETGYGDASADKPMFTDCMMNRGKCWSTGTSLWASEYWIPCVLPCGNEAIWEKLEDTYRKRIEIRK